MKEYVKEDLRPYHTFGFPLLALMGILAVVGVVVTVVIKFVV